VRIKSAAVSTGIVAATALATVLGAAPPAGAAPNAATLYQHAMATTQGWSVHYVSSGVVSKVSNIESGDTGPASGTQQVAIHGTAASDTASLIVIGQITYVNANATGLVGLMNLSPADATVDAGKWILFSTANAAFSQIVAGVRSRDVAQEIALKGPFTLGAPRTLNGYAVNAIRGTVAVQGSKPAHAVLYVRSSGRPLPVEEDTVDAQGKPNGEDHIVFSKWGERVRPRAPDAVITLGPVSAT
jgi:type IV secretory pathway protease TraF